MCAPERCSAQVGSDLTHKQITKLERPARDKHSRLFGPFVSFKEKKFYNTGPGGMYYKHLERLLMLKM